LKVLLILTTRLFPFQAFLVPFISGYPDKFGKVRMKSLCRFQLSFSTLSLVILPRPKTIFETLAPREFNRFARLDGNRFTG
jgi:hypothetical protein